MEGDFLNFEWDSQSSHILINPRYPEVDQRFFKRILQDSPFSAHLWLATSGSTVKKWVGLSKQALLNSAEAVNKHLESRSTDVWIHTLPDFHVGGVGIWARSYMSGAQVKDFKAVSAGKKWEALAFYQFLQQNQGTLTALVPAQLYDLVQLGLTAPRHLRAVVIGGGALSEGLYRKAVKLGWPILPSYGLTECASQVATGKLGCWENELQIPSMQILPHLHVKEELDGRLSFKGTSLISAYAYYEESSFKWLDPKVEGWFMSEDQGKKEGTGLQIQGRIDDRVKVGGENVDLFKLEAVLKDIQLELNLSGSMALVAMGDDRLGHAIHLVMDQISARDEVTVVARFQAQVLPFEKIRKVHHVPHIPRSSLNKVLKAELLSLITI